MPKPETIKDVAGRLKDILTVENEYYVRATSALADDRTRVLKYGETFAVFNRVGDIEALGALQFGLFYRETRHLSSMTFRVNGSQPMLLSSTIRDDNTFLSVDLSNVDAADAGIITLPRGTIHFFRSKFLEEGCCREQIRVINYGVEPVAVPVSFHFDADFADIFEVRGSKRLERGVVLPPLVDSGQVVLRYLGLDKSERHTSLRFTPQPEKLDATSADFELLLEPKAERTIQLLVSCGKKKDSKSAVSYDHAFQEMTERGRQSPFEQCCIESSSKRFNTWLARSKSDLRMLTEGNPEKNYPYAGVPWFSTVFGRDGIITALECLWFAPAVGRGVLSFLAETQATEENAEQDAAPGKILHELRRGEMAVLKEVPFGKYYGSVDSTPLFLILAAAYYIRTNDLEFVTGLWPNIERALAWIADHGDVDGDGFVEYERMAETGLQQQGWKDSHDSVFHKDGRFAEPPIALCEVQSYVYGAKRGVAVLARAQGLHELAQRLDNEASKLQKKFERDFWSEELGLYVLALDGHKRQCQVRASNAGHVLLTRMADPSRAHTLAHNLMLDHSFSGWGVRTVAAGEARYNPMSYHNGSVWPHDNALIALGMSLYGMQDRAERILSGLYDASLQFDLHRLPELFCGFHRRADASGPTLYPVACAPQAWAAGAPFLLLRACIGLEIRAPERKLSLINPVLPAGLDYLRIEGLRVADATVDLLLQRHARGVAVEVLRKDGELEVVKSI
ncbi:MAG TPA: amylo-alpha-1,6-glucosidase [Candidatus Sulfotelmatobacter sp.]